MARQSKTAGENRNRELIERFYHEMWNRFDKALIPVLLAEDIRFRGSLDNTKMATRSSQSTLTSSSAPFRISPTKSKKSFPKKTRRSPALRTAERSVVRSSGSPRPEGRFNMRVPQCSDSVAMRSWRFGFWVIFMA